MARSRRSAAVYLLRTRVRHRSGAERDHLFRLHCGANPPLAGTRRLEGCNFSIRRAFTNRRSHNGKTALVRSLAVFTHRPLGSILGAALAGGVTAFAVASPPAPASAQGLFDFFFGSARRGPPPSAYADPSGRQGYPEHRSASGGSGTYCVRMCDGRYFALPRATGTAAAQLCSSFCPAASTKVFYGGNIDYASAGDGTRYSSLPSAFVYRDKIVDGCSCNGQRLLRPGDARRRNRSDAAQRRHRRDQPGLPGLPRRPWARRLHPDRCGCEAKARGHQDRARRRDAAADATRRPLARSAAAAVFSSTDSPPPPRRS